MPLEERISETFAENRLRTVLLTSFAVTAIALAAVGLYGTLSYFVSMRRREIGVRMAMGAVRPEIVSSFLLQGLRVSVAGCVGGLWLAAALGRGLAGTLYGVSALDAPTFAGVLVLVLLTAVVSSLYPAVRAARTDPMRTLREE
jgi:putative ABC transport system permease protein